MKLLTKSLLGLTAAALMGGSASAAVSGTVLIAGSTAFRAPATAAIIQYCIANGGVCYGVTDKAGQAAPNTTLSTASGLFGATHGLFINASTIGAATIIVETNWTGSAAGLLDVVTNNTTGDQFISTASSPTVTQIKPASSLYGSFSGSLTKVFLAPTMAFCDSYNTSIEATVATATITPGHTVGGTSSISTLAGKLTASNVKKAGDTVPQDAVGVIPFAWYAGNSTASIPPTYTNMTQQLANTLVSSGVVPESMLSGNASDSGNVVCLLGRNEDSGTRLCAFAEAGLGFAGPNCDQFELTFTGTSTTGALTTDSGGLNTSGLNTGGVAATVSSGADFDATSDLYTEQYLGWGSAGHSGYAAGGDVANALLAYNPVTSINIDGSVLGTDTYFVGYLGWSDGYALTSAGNVSGVAGPVNTHSTGFPLTYNGVTASVANIQNGSYTFWAYEHAYYLTSGTNGIGTNSTVADGIADLVYSTTAPTNSIGVIESPLAEPANANTLGYAPPAGILYGTMQVTRAGEGEVVQTTNTSL